MLEKPNMSRNIKFICTCQTYFGTRCNISKKRTQLTSYFDLLFYCFKYSKQKLGNRFTDTAIKACACMLCTYTWHLITYRDP
jgi:hypothetical protein